MTEEIRFIPGVTEDVNITDKAVEEFKRIKKQTEVPENFGLRISIKGGGCSGLKYGLGFDAVSKPTDTVIEKNGLKIYIDMKSYLYLLGTEVDFKNDTEGSGFVFNNPSAKNTCHCGSSFNV
ncbi:MAG: iron-sulfur cluster assembly accessory protein [Ignavibacteria bacterium]|nr:iron-sulfur cluster assembly accessory protein [Ignavibacteria bacterium]